MVFFFVFKQKTAYEMRISDWSSDVCSSDLSDIHAQRIDDAIAGESIDLKSELVCREHLLTFHLDALDAFVDPHDLFGEWNTHDQASASLAEILIGLVAVNDPHRLAKSYNHRLPRFGHDRQSAADQDQQGDGDDRSEEHTSER